MISYGGAYYALHCIVFKTGQKCGFHKGAYHLMHRIVIKTAYSKKADFTKEDTIQHIELLSKARKNVHFTMEHFKHCNLKLSKCRFHDGVYYTSYHFVIKSQNIPISWRSILHNASYCC